MEMPHETFDSLKKKKIYSHEKKTNQFKINLNTNIRQTFNYRHPVYVCLGTVYAIG